MSPGEDGGRVAERRASPRVRVEHAARLQFVTGISGASAPHGAELWPSLICRTRDVSEEGLGLFVPVVREGDDSFFGVEGPVSATLGLPTGAVEVLGAVVRYSWGEGGAGQGGFLVGVRVTGMGGADADRLRSYLGNPRLNE